MKKEIKVAYFPPGTPKYIVLSSNGKSLDKYCIRATTEEDLSTGNYILDETFLIEDNIQEELQEEGILKVLLDYGYEIFRISKVTVGTRYIDVVARQITIADSLTLWLEDVRPTNLNGQGAVSWLLNNAEGKKEIQIVSDIDTVATAYYQRISLYKALHDNDNSFLNRWGGEVQRRGYTIYINKRIGTDRGFSIREGKNLTGFKGTSNIDNLVTRARGQGYNGILGNYIDSPLIGSYNRIYTNVIKYDDVKVKDEYSEEGYDTLAQAQAELDRRINEEFSKNDIDKIKASYTINFVQLEKTEEYKNYIVAERLFIGDDCRVYIPKLKVDIKVRAMSRKYDILAQKTKEIKLSNYIEAKPLSIKQIVEKLELMDSTETILQLAKDNATSLIKGGLKNSHVIVKENEIVIGDTKDINTMTKVWRWNNGGLGFSSTGYYGEFGTAITNDGAIVADFITTGILNAGLIKTGLLQSVNGSTWINMEDGTFKLGERLIYNGSELINKTIDGLEAIKIADTNIRFYDWTNAGKMLGIVASQFMTAYPNIRGFLLGHGLDSYMTLSYAIENGTYNPYIIFDKKGINPNYNAPIRVQEGTVFSETVNMQNRVYIPHQIIFDTKLNSNSPKTFKNTSDSRNILISEVSVNNVNDGFMIQTNTGGVLFSILAGSSYPTYFGTNVQVNADFTATGSKNSLQNTENYGERLLNAYETSEYYFGDIGSGVIKDGECIVYIDDIFKECVNTDSEYHVFTQLYNGAITKIERYKNYFVVHGEDDTEFSWELKAKRKGYENVRLDKPSIEEYTDNSPIFTEDFISNTSEKILIEDLNFNLEDILMEG